MSMCVYSNVEGSTSRLRGAGITLRVYRRYLHPVHERINGRKMVVYSDTRREEEINYDRAEDHELDDPWKRMALLRPAKAMK